MIVKDILNMCIYSDTIIEICDYSKKGLEYFPTCLRVNASYLNREVIGISPEFYNYDVGTIKTCLRIEV